MSIQFYAGIEVKFHDLSVAAGTQWSCESFHPCAPDHTYCPTCGQPCADREARRATDLLLRIVEAAGSPPNETWGPGYSHDQLGWHAYCSDWEYLNDNSVVLVGLMWEEDEYAVVYPTRADTRNKAKQAQEFCRSVGLKGRVTVEVRSAHE